MQFKNFFKVSIILFPDIQAEWQSAVSHIYSFGLITLHLYVVLTIQYQSLNTYCIFMF